MNYFKTISAAFTGIIILLGVLVFALGAAGVEGTIVSAKSVYYWGGYTWTFYTIDIWKWLKGLETSFQIETLGQIFPNMPELPSTPTNNADAIGWLKYVARVISVFVPNIAIFIFNLGIGSLKLLIYPIRIITALIGIDQTNNEVITLFNNLYSLSVPQIPYW